MFYEIRINYRLFLLVMRIKFRIIVPYVARFHDCTFKSDSEKKDFVWIDFRSKWLLGFFLLGQYQEQSLCHINCLRRRPENWNTSLHVYCNIRHVEEHLTATGLILMISTKFRIFVQ